MRNLVIVIIVGLMAWFTWSYFSKQEKPKNAVTDYAQSLKSSEDKADEAADTANLVILRSAISRFKGMTGKFPASLEELKSKGYIDRIPSGVAYNSSTGEVNR